MAHKTRLILSDVWMNLVAMLLYSLVLGHVHFEDAVFRMVARHMLCMSWYACERIQLHLKEIRARSGTALQLSSCRAQA